jgi:hypothetical protein
MGFRTQSTIEKSVVGVLCRHVAADGVLRELGCNEGFRVWPDVQSGQF